MNIAKGIGAISILSLVLLVGCDDENGAAGTDETDGEPETDTDTLSESDTEEDDTETGIGTDVDTEELLAFCQDQGESLNPVSGDCIDCTYRKCSDSDGDPTFEGLTGEVLELTMANGVCICDTEPGYYYSVALLKPVPCDVDGDGWVSITAKQFVESTDRAVNETAKCDVALVESFVLEAIDGTEVSVPVEDVPLSLYEPDQRDKEDQLQSDHTAPAYGESRFTAKELNPLTKACTGPIADYNANVAPDVEEWEGHDTIGPDYKVFARFAYFVELHTGWYEPPTGGKTYGRYRIKERSLAVDASAWNQVPVDGYSANGEHSYWRSCKRMEDAAYSPMRPSIGMELAWADREHDAAMYHHSLFKCLQVLDPGGKYDGENAPHLVNGRELDKYVINHCSLGTPVATADAVSDIPEANPDFSTFQCEHNDAPATGDVGLSLHLYISHAVYEEYDRGCLNSCLEDWPGIKNCEGVPASLACDPDLKNFGMPSCGCVGNYDYESNCTKCKENFDVATNCETCLGNFDPEWQCQKCLLGFDGDNCDECADNWDPMTGCTTCTADVEHGFWDLASGCTTCLSDPILGYWANDTCDMCAPNRDWETGCRACKNHWIRDRDLEYDNCELCAYDQDNGRWDPKKDCAECIDFSGDPNDPANTHVGHWDMATGCKTCKDLWTGADCNYCMHRKEQLPQDDPGEPINHTCNKTANLLQYRNPDAESCIKINDNWLCNSWIPTDGELSLLQTDLGCQLGFDGGANFPVTKLPASNTFGFEISDVSESPEKIRCISNFVNLSGPVIDAVENDLLTTVVIELDVVFQWLITGMSADVSIVQFGAGMELDRASLNFFEIDQMSFRPNVYNRRSMAVEAKKGVEQLAVTLMVKPLANAGWVLFDNLDLYLK